MRFDGTFFDTRTFAKSSFLPDMRQNVPQAHCAIIIDLNLIGTFICDKIVNIHNGQANASDCKARNIFGEEETSVTETFFMAFL